MLDLPKPPDAPTHPTNYREYVSDRVLETLAGYWETFVWFVENLVNGSLGQSVAWCEWSDPPHPSQSLYQRQVLSAHINM